MSDIGPLTLIRQRTKAGCGLACAAMVARAFCVEPIEALLNPSIQDSRGLSMKELLDLLRGLGLPAIAGLVTESELRLLQRPVVLHLSSRHYIVGFAASGERVWLFDPAKGVSLVRYTSLRTAWSGAAIYFEPLRIKPDCGEPNLMLGSDSG